MIIKVMGILTGRREWMRSSRKHNARWMENARRTSCDMIVHWKESRTSAYRKIIVHVGFDEEQCTIESHNQDPDTDRLRKQTRNIWSYVEGEHTKIKRVVEKALGTTDVEKSRNWNTDVSDWAKENRYEWCGTAKEHAEKSDVRNEQNNIWTLSKRNSDTS